MVDPGKGPRGPGPPLFLDQTEVQRAEKKNFFETEPPLPRETESPPPPYLVVWIRHCLLLLYLCLLLTYVVEQVSNEYFFCLTSFLQMEKEEGQVFTFCYNKKI